MDRILPKKKTSSSYRARVRIEVQKSKDDKISDEEYFVGQMKELLQTSEEIVKPFEHNEDEDLKEEEEEERAKGKGKKNKKWESSI